MKQGFFQVVDQQSGLTYFSSRRIISDPVF